MLTSTLQALNDSILKWEANAQVENVDEARIFGHHCPLCKLFILAYCIGCPVEAKTGHQYCVSSPWEDAYQIWLKHNPKNNLTAEFCAAAEKEVAFLKSLLPQN